MNKNYRKGYRIERKAIEELKKAHGCFLVIRSAGSKGVFDLVGFSGICFLVQVKARKNTKPTKREIEHIKSSMPLKPHYIWCGLWIWNYEDKEFKKYWWI